MLTCLIQARSTSTRFPNKCFELIDGKHNSLDMLYQTASGILPTWFIVPEDDTAIIEHLDKVKNYPYMTGPFEPLKRYVKCATALRATAIVRLTADCPFLSDCELAYLVGLWHQSHADFISNAHPETRHSIDGNDCEIISMKCLRWLDTYAQGGDREHVCAHLYRHPNYVEKEKLSTIFYRPLINYYKLIKTSIDTKEDLERLKACL